MDRIISSRDLNGAFSSESFLSPVSTSADFLDAGFPFMSNSMGFNFLNPSDLYSTAPQNNFFSDSDPYSTVNESRSELTSLDYSDTRFPFMNNSQGLNFLSPSSLYSSGGRSNVGVDEGAGEQPASVAQDVKPGFSSIAEESIKPEIAAETEEAETAVESVEAGESIAEGSSPVGLALMVNQQLGQAVNQTMNQGTEQQITKDMIVNSQQNGLNVGLNSSLIRSTQEQTRSNQDLGGTIGSLFGPLGALIGHAIAGTVQPDSQYLNTANSFGGALNPSDTNAVASASTADLSGQSNLVNNVN